MAAYQQAKEIEELDVADPVVGPADRRLPGPGIPELAEGVVRATDRRASPLVALALAGVSPIRARADHAELAVVGRAVAAGEAGPGAARARWDKLDAQRKQKWRGIAQRYPTMHADEQQRIQQQMQRGRSSHPSSGARARAVQDAEGAAAREEGRSAAEVAGVPEPAARAASASSRPSLAPTTPRGRRRRAARRRLPQSQPGPRRPACRPGDDPRPRANTVALRDARVGRAPAAPGERRSTKRCCSPRCCSLVNFLLLPLVSPARAGAARRARRARRCPIARAAVLRAVRGPRRCISSGAGPAAGARCR